MFIWMPPTEAPDSRPAPDKVPENSPGVPDFFVLPDVPLRAIRDFAGMPLSWVQLKTGFSRRTFELRCGEETLGLVRHMPMPFDPVLSRKTLLKQREVVGGVLTQVVNVSH
jgi:hypothetical protein